MFRSRGSSNIEAEAYSAVWNKALRILFSSERENSYVTTENRREAPSFSLPEVGGILFLQGQKLAQGKRSQTFVLQQEKHLLFRKKTANILLCVCVKPKNCRKGSG